MSEFSGKAEPVRQEDFERAAERLCCDLAAVRAVGEGGRTLEPSAARGDEGPEEGPGLAVVAEDLVAEHAGHEQGAVGIEEEQIDVRRTSRAACSNF